MAPKRTCRVRRSLSGNGTGKTEKDVDFRPAHLVHTDEGAFIESTASGQEKRSLERSPRRSCSSAVEHPRHMRGVIGSKPITTTLTQGSRRKRQPKARATNRCYVYFAQSGEGGPIKIGVTGDFQKRLVAMQTDNPCEIIVLGLIRTPDARNIEARLHRQFAGSRVRGEWFLPTPSLLDFIETASRSPEDIEADAIAAFVSAIYPPSHGSRRMT